MFAPALRRHRRDGAFDQLEQRLLHALAGNVARDGRAVRLARDLVDFVDVDDARLGLLDVVIAVQQDLLDDALHVVTDVTGFGQRRGIGNRERHVQHACQGFGQQRLAGAGRADQQDVALGQLHVIAVGLQMHPLVVVVHGNRQDPFRAVLPDDVLVQHLLDLGGLRQVLHRFRSLLLRILANDVVTQLHAFVADEHRGPRDQFMDLMLAFSAKGAVQRLSARFLPRFLITHRVAPHLPQ